MQNFTKSTSFTQPVSNKIPKVQFNFFKREGRNREVSMLFIKCGNYIQVMDDVNPSKRVIASLKKTKALVDANPNMREWDKVVIMRDARQCDPDYVQQRISRVENCTKGGFISDNISCCQYFRSKEERRELYDLLKNHLDGDGEVFRYIVQPDNIMVCLPDVVKYYKPTIENYKKVLAGELLTSDQLVGIEKKTLHTTSLEGLKEDTAGEPADLSCEGEPHAICMKIVDNDFGDYDGYFAFSEKELLTNYFNEIPEGLTNTEWLEVPSEFVKKPAYRDDFTFFIKKPSKPNFNRLGLTVEQVNRVCDATLVQIDEDCDDYPALKNHHKAYVESIRERAKFLADGTGFLLFSRGGSLSDFLVDLVDDADMKRFLFFDDTDYSGNIYEFGATEVIIPRKIDFGYIGSLLTFGGLVDFYYTRKGELLVHQNVRNVYIGVNRYKHLEDTNETLTNRFHIETGEPIDPSMVTKRRKLRFC